jgi:hypothetical protein
MRLNAPSFLARTAIAALAMAATASAADRDKRLTKPFRPTSEYVSRTIEGWTVRVDGRLIKAEKALGDAALKLLGHDLYAIARVIPERPCTELRKVTIWLALDEGTGVAAEYHPSGPWLKANGHNPDKAKAVEIGDAKKYLSWSRTQPCILLHELSHAYHDHVFGYDHPRFKEAYAEAVKGGKYESVLHASGRKRRHYALTNPMEYFAEATEAYFGTNDFYPFVRAELKAHDPGAVRLLEAVWVKGEVTPRGKADRKAPQGGTK